MPIDPCGYAVDVARSCGVYRVRPWRDRTDTVLIRTYRVPYGTPALPFGTRFLLPEFDDSISSGRDRYGLKHDSCTVAPGEPGLPVGLAAKRVSYSKGTRPVGWRQPTHYVGTPEQWLDGSVYPRHQPLIWRGAWSTACRQLDAVGCASYTGCDQCPVMSAIWIVGAPDFAGFSEAAVVAKQACSWDSKCVPAPGCDTGTSAAWQVVLAEPFGGLTNGTLAWRHGYEFSSCCKGA